MTFEPNHYSGDGQALLLQRTFFRGAQTFDMEVLNGDRRTSLEFRLVKNSHLAEVKSWGTDNHMLVFQSTEILTSSLLFRAYRELKNENYTSAQCWEEIAKAVTGEDSDEEDEDDVAMSGDDEWVPEEDEDSDDSIDEDDEDAEEDLLECLRD